MYSDLGNAKQPCSEDSRDHLRVLRLLEWSLEIPRFVRFALPRMQDNMINTVCQAITTLYSGSSTVHEEQYFLKQFQESVEAWTVCDAIIAMHQNSLAVYFAAQTLRTKISKQFRQLPPESYIPLRDSLINHLRIHGKTTHDDQTEAISTQLCVAVADLYIQVPQWTNWIAGLINQFHQLEGDRTATLLTLLRVFPEEVEEQAGIGENRRDVVRKELAESGKNILTFLTHVFATYQNSTDMIKKVLYCLNSTISNPLFFTDDFATSPLLQSVFQIVATTSPQLPPSLHEVATEVIGSALLRVEQIEQNYPLAKILQVAILQLYPAFQAAAELEDLDKLHNFTRLFVEMNESFCVKMAAEAPTDPSEIGNLACLELLLLVAEHHDFTLVDMSFNVWYRISEELFRINDDDHIARFRPYVKKYIMSLYRHCRLDTDETDAPEPNSDFAEFRLKVIDTLRDVVFIVHTDECLRMVFSLLKENSAKPQSTWDECEAALFLMSAVVQNLMPEDDGVMPELLQAIVSLPVTSHPAIILTCTSLIGDCNEWLEKHTNFVEPTIRWLLNFVGQPRYAARVAETIENVSSKCAREMTGVVPELLNFIEILENANTLGSQVEEAINHLLKACSTLIFTMEYQQTKLGVERLCLPIIENLQKAMRASNEIEKIENKENETATDTWARQATSPILWIDRVASIFREVWKPAPGPNVPDAPWLEVAKGLFQVLLQAMNQYSDKVRHVEHCCRSLRYLVRSLGVQSSIFVVPLVNSMVNTYRRYQHSCILYLSSVLVDEYGSFDESRPVLLELAVELFAISSRLLKEKNGYIEHPDTVDDLFRLAARLVLRAPSAFFSHPTGIAPELYAAAIEGLQLDHCDANRSVTKFLNEIIDQILIARKKNYMDNGVKAAIDLVSTQGKGVVASALNAALFKLSGQLRRDMAEVIASTGKFDKQKQREWLVFAVASLPNEPVKATGEQLGAFVEGIAHNAENSTYSVFTQIKELIKLFS
ncbi:unnamed protein product [Caenorhabditis auriculariae]|uniref:Importin N-terminal domain-containing protein n=1 Tax=Caenorhabditis auriculariae TaxID=2777116 RepID=A0A8S1HGZ2_9PELO|nr:unnamed protein product [Caenorhabditis auriculariae]